MRRMIGPLLVGVFGVAILISLGVWQLQRLQWKEAKLAAISAMLAAAPEPLPQTVSDAADRYRAVTVSGTLTGEAVYKLDSLPDVGPGKRVIAVLDAGGRRVLVDLGILLESTKPAPLTGPVSVVGNLDWPEEVDSFTPAPSDGLWFARDVAGMAAALKADPVMIVAAKPVLDGIVPMPVDTSGIPNDHWHYALTWFSLAFVWFVMTGAWLWRIRRQTAKAG